MKILFQEKSLECDSPIIILQSLEEVNIHLPVKQKTKINE